MYSMPRNAESYHRWRGRCHLGYSPMVRRGLFYNCLGATGEYPGWPPYSVPVGSWMKAELPVLVYCSKYRAHAQNYTNNWKRTRTKSADTNSCQKVIGKTCWISPRYGAGGGGGRRQGPVCMHQFDMLARPTFLVLTLINTHLILFPQNVGHARISNWHMRSVATDRVLKTCKHSLEPRLRSVPVVQQPNQRRSDLRTTGLGLSHDFAFHSLTRKVAEEAV